MRRTLATLLVLSVSTVSVAVSLTAPHAARAAEPEGPYTIRASGDPTWAARFFDGSQSGAVTEAAFTAGRRCDPRVLDTPLQGLDAYVLDVSAYEDQTVRVDWTATGSTPTYVFLNVYSSTCLLTRQARSAEPGRVSLDDALGTVDVLLQLPSDEAEHVDVVLPLGTKWLVVAPQEKVDVSFTLTAFPAA